MNDVVATNLLDQQIRCRSHSTLASSPALRVGIIPTYFCTVVSTSTSWRLIGPSATRHLPLYPPPRSRCPSPASLRRNAPLAWLETEEIIVDQVCLLEKLLSPTVGGSPLPSVLGDQFLIWLTTDQPAG